MTAEQVAFQIERRHMELGNVKWLKRRSRTREWESLYGMQCGNRAHLAKAHLPSSYILALVDQKFIHGPHGCWDSSLPLCPSLTSCLGPLAWFCRTGPPNPNPRAGSRVWTHPSPMWAALIILCKRCSIFKLISWHRCSGQLHLWQGISESYAAGHLSTSNYSPYSPVPTPDSAQTYDSKSAGVGLRTWHQVAYREVSFKKKTLPLLCCLVPSWSIACSASWNTNAACSGLEDRIGLLVLRFICQGSFH